MPNLDFAKVLLFSHCEESFGYAQGNLRDEAISIPRLRLPRPAASLLRSKTAELTMTNYKLLTYFSADLLTTNGLRYVSLLENIQNNNRDNIVPAESYCRMIHYSKILRQHLVVR